MSFKIIRDAVHGDLSFSTAELRLVDTETMQRLRGIKQLGTSSLVYPAATHTRFEHSLGACAMAKRILAAMSRAGARHDEELVRAVAAAALLHDVTHIPFGHTFEDERRLFDRHDESEARVNHYLRESDLGEELRRQGLNDSVEAILGKASAADEWAFAREVVAGTICADLLDYLRRDARFCGLSQDYDDRLFRYFVREGDRVVINLRRQGIFRPDALSELVNLLRLRYNLTERVYYHHAKVAAGAMISKALELCLQAGEVTPDDLLDRKDDSFLDLLARRGKNVPGVSQLLDDLNRRRLLKQVYYQTLEQPGLRGLSPGVQAEFQRAYHLNEGNARDRFERHVESQLGLPPGSVIVYCPAASMALKEADVLVLLDSGGPQMLSALHHPEVEVLLYKHRALWRFYVFIRREFLSLREQAGRCCEDRLGQPNLLEPGTRGELAFGRPPRESK